MVDVEGVLPNALSSPYAEVSVLHDLDRSAAGNKIVDAETVTSITTGDSLPLGDDPTVPADSFIWLETGATGVSGTVSELHLTMRYTED